LGAIIGSVAQKVMMVCEDVSRYELVNIFQQQPRSVWVVVDGTEMEIPFAQLKAGDVLVLDVGHTIPVDGVIVDGIASIDQHMLTGELATGGQKRGRFCTCRYHCIGRAYFRAGGKDWRRNQCRADW
jgi:Cation transport ATPase